MNTQYKLFFQIFSGLVSIVLVITGLFLISPILGFIFIGLASCALLAYMFSSFIIQEKQTDRFINKIKIYKNPLNSKNTDK